MGKASTLKIAPGFGLEGGICCLERFPRESRLRYVESFANPQTLQDYSVALQPGVKL